MIVVRYNRTPETTRDLITTDEDTSTIVESQITAADTFLFQGAIFAVVSRKYDFDTDTLIIYVK